jgi:uncharacterized protein HemX
MPPTENFAAPVMPPMMNAPTPFYQKKGIWIALGAVVLILILAGGGYYWYSHHMAKKVVPLTPLQQQELYKTTLDNLPNNPNTRDVTTQEKVNILDSLGTTKSAPVAASVHATAPAKPKK